MKVAIYCRVSTENQYQKGVSIKDQKQRGIEFCIEKNYEYEVFEELASSGTKPVEERPKLFELLKRTERTKRSLRNPNLKDCISLILIGFQERKDNTR